jgi:hypothetical protein
MKREAELREALIANAIHLIATGGFEMATTKRLTHVGEGSSATKINEVYIYRLFGSKEHLYEASFVCLDNELINAFRGGVAAVGDFRENTKERLFRFFMMAWSFILGNEERSRAYVRYYYSVYFRGSSREMHKKLFSGIVREMTPLFKGEADALAILHSVFTTLFDFAIRVFNGDLEDNDINRPHIFNMLYVMMAAYFKDTVKEP